MAHGDVGSGGIVHRHDHGKRPGAPLPGGVDLLIGVLERMCAAEPGAPINADALRRARNIEPARRNRLCRGADSELACAVEISGFGLGKEPRWLPVDERSHLRPRALRDLGREAPNAGARVA